MGILSFVMQSSAEKGMHNGQMAYKCENVGKPVIGSNCSHENFTLVRNSTNVCSVSNLVSYIFSKIHVRLYMVLKQFLFKVRESFPFYQVDFFLEGRAGVSTQSFHH